MKQFYGFVSAVMLAVSAYVGYVAYQDHKVVKALAVLTSEVGTLNSGQKVTAVDIAAALIDERVKQLATHAEAPKP